METLPIWYVIMEPGAQSPMILTWRVTKCFSCTLADIDRLWKEEVQPMYDIGRRPTAYIIERDVPNPFNTFEQSQTEKSVWDI